MFHALRFISLSVVLAFLASPVASASESLDAAEAMANELGLSRESGERLVGLISEGFLEAIGKNQRVAVDGFGSFEPTYEFDQELDRALHGLRFNFDLGPALEHPCFETVFDEDIVKAISQVDGLKFTGPDADRRKRLTVEEAGKALDILVLAALYNTDHLGEFEFGTLGTFVPRLSIDASKLSEEEKENRVTQLDISSARHDTEREAEAIAYALNALGTAVQRLEREGRKLLLFAWFASSAELREVGDLVWETARLWRAEFEDLAAYAQRKATSHNAARSNRSNGIIDQGNDLLEEALEKLAEVPAQDYNSSRSNNTATSLAWVNNGMEAVETRLAAPATSHNAARSNRSNGIFYSDSLGDIADSDAAPPATSHNASRSNRSSGVFVDFDLDERAVAVLNPDFE